jgi:DNA-binding CsgD family transcriptional regulator
MEAAITLSPKLTRQQRRIVPMLLDGMPDHVIAERMNLEVTSVRTHLFRLYQRFGVHSRWQLIFELQRTHYEWLEQRYAAMLEHIEACPCPCCEQLQSIATDGVPEQPAYTVLD